MIFKLLLRVYNLHKKRVHNFNKTNWITDDIDYTIILNRKMKNLNTGQKLNKV